jgi:integrase
MQKINKLNKSSDAWVYPKASGITIREVNNQTNGKDYGIAYEVRLPTSLVGKGQRVRKRFKSASDAEHFAKGEFNNYRKFGSEYGKIDEQTKHEVGLALSKIADSGLGLTDAVDFALPRLRPENGSKKLSLVISELNQLKLIDLERGEIRPRTQIDFNKLGLKILKEIGDPIVQEIYKKDIFTWLNSLDLSPRTKANRLNTLGEVLGFAVSKGYCADNVVSALTSRERKELHGSLDKQPSSIGHLKVTQAEMLIKAALKHIDLDLLGAVTLGLFCGIRTEEIKRLEWAKVNLEKKIVTIGEDIAKKRRIRNVTIPENAISWLEKCSNRKGMVTRHNHTNDYQKRFSKLWKLAQKEYGIEEPIKWIHNGMRHSFGTYHYALHGDPILTCRELGHKYNEDDVLFTHYRALMDESKAEAYFKLMP